MVEGNSAHDWFGHCSNEPWLREERHWRDALVFSRLCPFYIDKLNALVDSVMEGTTPADETEIEAQGRWYRLKVVADIATSDVEGGVEGSILGILGCAMDISDMKARTTLEIENARLQADQKLAEEQNRLKSQFLANM